MNSTKNLIKRRDFFKNIAVASAGIAVGGKMLSCTKNKPYQYDIMQEVRKYRKIDAHNHVHLRKANPSPETEIEWIERLGFEKLVVSKPISRSRGKATPKEVREVNNQVLECMKRYPDKFIGQCFINPEYQKESLEEIDRCIDEGMVGLKVYNQAKINDPLFYPIVEKFIDLKMIILMHAECQLGVGGYRMKYDINRPFNTSIPEDFVDIAKRYPEAMFQYAHIGGGFDWEYACKMLADSPNVWVDTSGSNNEEYMIDFALKTLGEDRILFGSDMSYYQSVGKVLASNLNETQKKKLFFENYNNILRKAGRDVS
ncbi:amidohydrolase family protein [candidate division KSB1 bacterium]